MDRCRGGEEDCNDIRGIDGGGEGGGGAQKLEVAYCCMSAVVWRLDAWGEAEALGDGNIGTPVASRTADSSHSAVTLVVMVFLVMAQLLPDICWASS